MVENFDNIRETFRGYTGYNEEIFNNVGYIAIKNTTDVYNPPGAVGNVGINTENYQNLSVCASATFPNFANIAEIENFPPEKIDGVDGFWKNANGANTHVFGISGLLNDCKLKKIFSNLTRFTAAEARIRLRPGDDPLTNATADGQATKTLNNTVIFVSKRNIHRLFYSGVGAGLRGGAIGGDGREQINTFMTESLKFKTLLFNNRCYICNYFRVFNDIPNINNAGAPNNDPVRNSLDLGDNQGIISNNRLQYFRQFINETRQVAASMGNRFYTLGSVLRGNIIVSEVIGILRKKKSLPQPLKRNIINDYTGKSRSHYYKQHYIGDLGNTNSLYPNGFGVTLYNRLQELELRTEIEKIISTILVITSTNGMNVAGGGCILVTRYEANNPINIPPNQEFTLLSNNVQISVDFIQDANFFIELPANSGGVNTRATNRNGGALNNVTYIDVGPAAAAPVNGAAFGTGNDEKKFYVNAVGPVTLQLPINTKIYNRTGQPQTITPAVAIDGTMG